VKESIFVSLVSHFCLLSELVKKETEVIIITSPDNPCIKSKGVLCFIQRLGNDYYLRLERKVYS